MNAAVKLTGYDKVTELLVTVDTVPDNLAPVARTLAGVPNTDRDGLAMYPLTSEQAATIAGKADLALDQSRYDYFLEAVAEEVLSLVRNV